MAKRRGRPHNRHEPYQLKITGTPKLERYLDDLVKEQGYGNSKAAVALALIWRGFEDLIAKGVLDRRKE